jgi:hypothetical protein
MTAPYPLQKREKVAFERAYTPPADNGTVITRDRYKEVCEALAKTVPVNEGDNPYEGMEKKDKRALREMLVKWQRFVMVGGTVQLRRIKGPYPDKHYLETGEYPKVTCLDEVFDILWEIHHLSGHVKTPATLHSLSRERGLWGIPREACKTFVECCMVCSMSKRILKKQESCTPILAKTYNDRSQMDLIGTCAAVGFYFHLLPYCNPLFHTDMRTMEYDGYCWILRTVDLNTKYGCAVALKNKTAMLVGYEMAVFWSRMGCPAILQSDNGSEFLGDCLKAVAAWSAGEVKIINGKCLA